MAKSLKLITVIHADDRPNTVMTCDAQLKTLQKLVGGYIELIPCFNKFNGRRVSAAYCNDEGKINGLRINKTATVAWYACDDRICDDLAGDVVYCPDNR